MSCPSFPLLATNLSHENETSWQYPLQSLMTVTNINTNISNDDLSFRCAQRQAFFEQWQSQLSQSNSHKTIFQLSLISTDIGIQLFGEFTSLVRNSYLQSLTSSNNKQELGIFTIEICCGYLFSVKERLKPFLVRQELNGKGKIDCLGSRANFPLINETMVIFQEYFILMSMSERS